MIPMIRFRSRIPWRVALLCVALSVAPHALRADDLRDGKKALDAGRLDEAAKYFEAAAGQGFAEGRAGVGQVWLKRRQYGKAMEAFQMAQKMDPNLAMGYYGQGEVLRRQDKCDAALPLLRKAVDLDKKFPIAQLALGDCLVQTKKHEEAVQVLSQGLKWGKWRPRFLVALGDAEMARDSLRDAGIYYTKAREESPEDPAPRRALGDFYVRRGTFELAVPEYQSAMQLDSSDVELEYALGRALFFAQRYNEALEAYRNVVRRDPEFPLGQFALGDLYYRSGQADRRRFQDARAPLEKFIQLAPEDPKGWSVLGRTYYQLGLRDSALTAMNKAEKLGDKTKEMYTIRARLRVERKEWDAALADFALGESAPEDELRMAQVLVIMKQQAKAESLYRDLISRDSTSRHGKFAQNELGKLRYREQDYPAAVAQFERLIALDPGIDEAYYYLGLSYKQLKKYPEASAALRQAAERADGNAERHFWYGMVCAEMDSLGCARRELSRAVALDSAATNKNTGFALRQLGYYELLGKNYAEAIRMLERSVAINDSDVQAWVWLAQGYHNHGDRNKACEAYDRVLSLDASQAVAVKGKKALGCSQQ